ncbi:MAG TPA: hypothetical protein VJ326_06240 [Thermoplasmata archaeon]|nr:hypothetical protein [Thermoplasmata archaeon]
MPLGASTLPFNIDGFPLVRIAEGISDAGAWRIDEADPNSYNQKMPAFSLLWAAAVGLGGLEPLRDIQWVLPLVTSFAVVAGYLFALKLTGHRGVAFAAGLFLAVFGSFLFLTSAVMKESLGLLVLPVTLLLFAGRRDPRQRGLALLLLLVLPFLHHLTTLIALGTVASLLVLEHGRASGLGRFSPRALAVDIATGPLAAIPAVAYYSAVEMPFFRDVTSPDEVALFLAITVVLTFLLARAWKPARARPGRSFATPSARTFVVPAIAFGGILVNAGTGVFAGAASTRPLLLGVVLPGFLGLAMFAVVGWQGLRRTTNRANDLVLAVLAAPTALVIFGFLRGLDPLSLAIVYRAFDFMDLALAPLAGIGMAILVARMPSRRLAGAVLGVVFAASLVATTPLAWDTQAALGVENVTTPEEFRAFEILAGLGAVNVTTDQRLADIAEWWFGIAGDPSLPVRLADGEPVEAADYAVLLERWTSVGAQVHPAPNVVLERDDIDAFLASNRIVYSAGRPGDRVWIVRIVDAGGA